ncbi:hypothetical protein [Sphingorhabdus sp.]|jgi:hypothetical protein|uniref:hypothetical protein n=1 Tax=Sphingorhabdus sp. TaxID=1902408 RepID=UPI0037C5C4F1
MLFFAIALAITPSALTDAHQGDIACVAVLATLAEKQRTGTAPADAPDVRQSGNHANWSRSRCLKPPKPNFSGQATWRGSTIAPCK